MYYVIQTFDTKEAADRCATKAPDWTHAKVLSDWEYTCRMHFQDIEVIAREILGWNEEQIQAINKEWVVDSLMDFNFNDYFAFLEQSILQSVKEQNQEVVVIGSTS